MKLAHYIRNNRGPRPIGRMQLKPILKLISVPYDEDGHCLLADIHKRWKEKAIAIHPDRTGDSRTAARWNELCQRAVELAEMRSGIRKPKLTFGNPTQRRVSDTRQFHCAECGKLVEVIQGSGIRIDKMVVCPTLECRRKRNERHVKAWRKRNPERVRTITQRAQAKRRAKLSGTRGSSTDPLPSAVTALNAGLPSPAFPVAASET